MLKGKLMYLCWVSWVLTAMIWLIPCHCPKSRDSSLGVNSYVNYLLEGLTFLELVFLLDLVWLVSVGCLCLSLSRKLFCQPLHYGRREVWLRAPRRLPVWREQWSELPGEQTSDGMVITSLLPYGASLALSCENKFVITGSAVSVAWCEWSGALGARPQPLCWRWVSFQ